MKKVQRNTKLISLLAGTMLVTGSLFAAASPVGDVVGKVTVGYQGWFACTNDGSPLSYRWRHWTTNKSKVAGPTNRGFDLWPDMSEYTTTYPTDYKLAGNVTANLYSSYSDQVVNKHVEWMQTYKIDTIAVQRFGNGISTDASMRAWKNGICAKVKTAAETYGRKFYVMYDISDWTAFQTEMKTDWTSNIVATLALTNSSAYAKQNGKPVMCIWGIGSEDRPGDNTSWNDVVNFMKAQGCYVILGVVKSWATNTASVYTNGNMISPWSVGAYTSNSGADTYANQLATEAATCHNRGQDFLPVVWPGFSWANWKIKDDGTIPPQNQIPRMHGDFMWRQLYNVRNKNIPSVYVAMFDEFDEATAICKAAPSAATAPTNQWFLTLNADGTACSSDFYLRLTGDGGDMIKSNAVKVTNHPTAHTVATGTTVTFYSVAAHDGYVQESSETSTTGSVSYATSNTTSSIRVGDTSTKQQLRGFVSFDCSSLPDTCTIVSATLRLKRGTIAGTPTTLSNITVDVKNVNTGWSDNVTLQPQDFQGAASSSSVATLSYPTANDTWASGALNATGLTKINATTASHTQYRIRFATDDDNDATADYLGFYSGEAASGSRPELVVTYQ